MAYPGEAGQSPHQVEVASQGEVVVGRASQAEAAVVALSSSVAVEPLAAAQTAAAWGMADHHPALVQTAVEAPPVAVHGPSAAAQGTLASAQVAELPAPQKTALGKSSAELRGSASAGARSGAASSPGPAHRLRGRGRQGLAGPGRAAPRWFHGQRRGPFRGRP